MILRDLYSRILEKLVISEGIIDTVFEEFENDLKLLREGMRLCKFERDRDKIFQHLVKKYERDYCPSHFYSCFSEETKLSYDVLRLEIDDILKRKEQFFSDFL